MKSPFARINHVPSLDVAYEDEDKHPGTVGSFVYMKQATERQVGHIQSRFFVHLTPCR